MKIIRKIFSVLFFPLKLIVLALIYFYKFAISPMLPHCCKFQPTCSTYMITAINRFGVFKGTFLGLKRICRCTPKAKGGVDNVPENLKGETLWLL